MVATNEEHIPPLERFAAVLGAIKERTKTTQQDVHEIKDALGDLMPRVQSLEEDRKQRDRRTALIGGGAGLGGTGLIIVFWDMIEVIFKGMPK